MAYSSATPNSSSAATADDDDEFPLSYASILSLSLTRSLHIPRRRRRTSSSNTHTPPAALPTPPHPSPSLALLFALTALRFAAPASHDILQPPAPVAVHWVSLSAQRCRRPPRSQPALPQPLPLPFPLQTSALAAAPHPQSPGSSTASPSLPGAFKRYPSAHWLVRPRNTHQNIESARPSPPQNLPSRAASVYQPAFIRARHRCP